MLPLSLYHPYAQSVTMQTRDLLPALRGDALV
nr:MAG TPA: hypothetical protein [Caudoviricetes sp.]